MMRQHKSHSLSHFVLGLPVEIPTGLLMSDGLVVRPVTKPELGFRYENVRLTKGSQLIERDVEKAVEAFMSIETYEDALGVLSVYGPFHHDNFDSFTYIQHFVRAAWKLRTGSMSDVQRWYKLMSVYERDPIAAELRDVYPGIMTLTVASPDVQIQLKDPPRLEFMPPPNILGALLIVLHLEKLQGIRHKYCALPDCRKPFELKNDKDRKFCSYDCSHKAAVRASRQRAKEERKKKSPERFTKGR